MALCFQEREHSVTQMSINDEINSDTSIEINAFMEQKIQQGLRTLIVDCSALTFVNSTGLSTLLLIHNRIRCQHGEVRFFGFTHVVLEVLAITRLDTLFSIDADEESAKGAFLTQK